MRSRYGQVDEAEVSLEETDSGEVTLWVDGRQAMQAWERELMHECADILVKHGSEFLEVGLGLGLSALRIAANPKTRRHLVLEKYPQVVELFHEKHPEPSPTMDIEIADFFDWIRAVPDESFDGIFFDPSLPKPVWDDAELWREISPHFARVLRPYGVFIPFPNTSPCLREQHVEWYAVATMQRRHYESYETTWYAHTQIERSGSTYIQCFYKNMEALRAIVP